MGVRNWKDMGNDCYNGYKRYVEKKGRLLVKYLEQYPDEELIPVVLLNDHRQFGDRVALTYAETKVRHRFFRDKLFLTLFLLNGCGHQGPGKCRQMNCHLLLQMVQNSFIETMRNTNDHHLAMTAALETFSLHYERDHHYSWARTKGYASDVLSNIINFLEEIIR